MRPFQVIETTGQITRVNGRVVGGDPFTVLERALAEFRVSPDEMPVPFGVFRCIEKPTYDDMMNDQVKMLLEKKGPGKLEDLFKAEDIWTVE